MYLRNVAQTLSYTDLFEVQSQTLDREPVEDGVLFCTESSFRQNQDLVADGEWAWCLWK